jgi:hypothetical protein
MRSALGSSLPFFCPSGRTVLSVSHAIISKIQLEPATYNKSKA